MREFINIIETYSKENQYFLQYMQNDQFDPYQNWYMICEWLENHDYIELVHIPDGETVETASELQEYAPELFYTLPEEIREECAEYVYSWLSQHDPAELPTYYHTSLSKQRQIPRTSWLVHFSDHAYEIWFNGFKYGADQMDKLGLTTYFSDKYRKSTNGYNFAFYANSRDATYAADETKYGKEAVIFQSSGIELDHYGDQETQIVFWGKSINPNSLIYLKNDYGDWIVESRKELNNGSTELFRGTYQQAVNWVMTNHDQYRKYLYRS